MLLFCSHEFSSSGFPTRTNNPQEQLGFAKIAYQRNIILLSDGDFESEKDSL